MDNPDIKALISKVNKDFGDNSIVLGSDIKNQPVQRYTSGSLSLDLALGGGWPHNKWCELVGNPSSGKTVVAMKTIAANQERDPDFTTLWVAAEELVYPWAEACGMDLDKVLIVATNVMEEVYQIVVDALATKAFDAIVIDSYPALVPGEEASKDVKDSTVALGAKMTSKFLRKAANTGRRSLTDDTERPWIGLIINQYRSKIGVMFGDPRTTPGGQHKDFEYFIRAEISRDEWLTDPTTKHKVGIAIKAKTIKNKTAPPQRTATFDFYFSKFGAATPGDYDMSKELFLAAVEWGVIQVDKRTYYYGDTKLGTSKADALLTVRSTLDLSESIEAEVRRIVTPSHYLETEGGFDE